MHSCNEPPARAHYSTEVLRLAADGDGRMVTVGSCQNRVEVLAFPAATLAAGDVQVFRVEADPTGNPALTSLAATILYNINGGRVVLEIPPGARIFIKLSGYAGAGEIVAVATSWEQK